MSVPAAVVARMRVAFFTRSSTFCDSRSTRSKSARMPWHIISGVILTMCAWRMWRRLTTSVICIRDCNSLGCTCTAKMETCEVSMSASTAWGMSTSGLGARSSSTNAFHWHPRLASSWPSAAAIGSVTRSVINVTFSAAAMRRQVVTAERAPGSELGGIAEREKMLSGLGHALIIGPHSKRSRAHGPYSEGTGKFIEMKRTSADFVQPPSPKMSYMLGSPLISHSA